MDTTGTATSRHRGHTAGMTTIQLFHLLQGQPGGVPVFRAVMRLRLRLRELSTMVLETLIVADLPCRGWAWRRRVQISEAWDKDLSEMRYIEAVLDEQPD
jgi:hypothetical protein